MDLYLEPYDPALPVVCLDEMPVQLLGHSRDPLPMKGGQDRTEDYEYVRQGAACVFGALEFKSGRRLLEASLHRAGLDFARFVKKVVEEFGAKAEKVRLVLDNLSTHSLGALYQAFAAEEARALSRKLEMHFTPKHGSWLNPIELEFAALLCQTLAKRVGSLDELSRAIKAWQDQRNEAKARVRWTFDTKMAREKLHRIYPAHET